MISTKKRPKHQHRTLTLAERLDCIGAPPGFNPLEVKRSRYERRDKLSRQSWLNTIRKWENEIKQEVHDENLRRLKPSIYHNWVYENMKTICGLPPSDPGSLVWATSKERVSVDTFGTSAMDVMSPVLFSTTASVSSIATTIITDDYLQATLDRLTTKAQKKAKYEVAMSTEEVFPEDVEAVNELKEDKLVSSSENTNDTTLTSVEKQPSDDEAQWMRAALNLKEKTDDQIRENWGGAPRNQTMSEFGFTHKIATDFTNWAKSSGLQKDDTALKQTIIELFEFENHKSPEVQAMTINIKELAWAPDQVIKDAYPELKERAAIYRHMLSDERYFRRPSRGIAFGSKDPKYFKKGKISPFSSWCKGGIVKPSFESGEEFFKPLIDKNSLVLEWFALGMIRNRSYYRPRYLVDSGYIDTVIAKHGLSEQALSHWLRTKNMGGTEIVDETEQKDSFFETKINRMDEIAGMYSKKIEQVYKV